jgi:hypothetical protein
MAKDRLVGATSYPALNFAASLLKTKRVRRRCCIRDPSLDPQLVWKGKDTAMARLNFRKAM